MMNIGDKIKIEVETIDERGQGVATPSPDLGGRSVVVPGLFPGERGEVVIEALSRHKPLAHAWLRAIIRPHAERRVVPCLRHESQPERDAYRTKPACAGCPMMALEIDAQREVKRAYVAREHGLELDALVGGDELGYRWSSKRVVSGRVGRLVLGSRVSSRRQRDWIADMHGCLVDHPKLTAAFDQLEQRANATGIEPGTGDLRYVWGKTNGEVVTLTLITHAAESRAARELGPWLVEQGIAAGVAHSVKANESNVIRGEGTQTIAGELEFTLALAGVELPIGPLGFLQPNPTVAAQAYRDLVGPPPADPSADMGNSVACDLYAGAGVTTALLRERFADVSLCESYPESAAALGIEPETAEQFCQRWLVTGRAAPELIVANPPRSGLGEEVCASLLALAPARVHIMSCNPATLRADLDRLAPGFELVGLRGYDTLPQTPHVELVAWLRRRPSAD